MRLATNSSAAPNSALRALRGVGPKLEAQLIEDGYDCLRALAMLRPRRFRDWRVPNPIASLPDMLMHPDPEDPSPEVLLVGTVVSTQQYHGRISVQKAEFDDGTGLCELVWFGRGGPRITLQAGMRLLVQGKPKMQRVRGALRIEIQVISHQTLAQGQPYVGRIWPIYPATRNITSRTLATIIERNIDRLLEEIAEEILPPAILERHAFLSPRETWRELHLPTSLEMLERAQARLSYEIFFGIAFSALHRRKARQRAGCALAMPIPPTLYERFESELPFALTGAQRRVIHEIWADLNTEAPMNRLLQGDVGCGKTVVAAACILLAAQAGAQSALMAPTELLARQHARKLGPMLAPFGVGVEFIAATQGAKARRETEDRLAAGAIAVAVGTHALLTERVNFARLGLAIIDEQHRFGVMQRAMLRAKGQAVHTLAMTATPIPRTLAQIRYADLDFSVIDELPPGRTPVKTYVRDETARPRIYDFIRKEVQAGRQVYIVAPVIEEGDSALRSALAEAEELQQHIFPDLRVGLVHGRLPARERDATMEQFAAGQIDILIATTVIEVGVDVPNAAIMIVLEAHRFGLAQLHQLRGRVGRGSAAATCILIAPRQTSRLAILTRTNDGFEIADADLELRGEGEFSGTMQSGAGQVLLRGRDEIALYQMARQDAETILEADPELVYPQHRPLLRLTDEALEALAVRVTS